MKVDIQNEQSLEIPPHEKVYTMTKILDDGLEVQCDIAWTTEQERRQHFWFNAPWLKDEESNIKLENMPMREFVERRAKMTEMNPFFTIAKLEWVNNYWKRWQDG